MNSQDLRETAKMLDYLTSHLPELLDKYPQVADRIVGLFFEAQELEGELELIADVMDEG